MKECDEEARALRENIEDQPNKINIKYLGLCMVKVQGIISNTYVKEMVSKVDAREIEEAYVKEKIGYNAEYVDVEARNVFPMKKVTTSIIKYANRYNYYGLRDVIINKNMINSECPQYSLPES